MHHFQKKLAYHYSVSHQLSLGAHYMSIDENPKQGYTLAQGNILLKRWNSTGAQGNAYALLSVGSSVQSQKAAMHFGLQGDWETRRIYTFVKADYYDLDRRYLNLRARLGLAPYIADFEDWHSWVMIQLDHRVSSDSRETTVMPVLRFFKVNYLLEFGYDFNDTMLVTAMVHL